MTTYALGDIQGCQPQLRELLEIIEEETPGAKLLFAGDLVNRGPRSLEALRQVRDLDDRAVTVLGNHDLHLLAVAAGIQKMKPGDSIQPVLDAPDREELIDWLRHRPMAYTGDGLLLVHAGVLPQWDLTKTMELAHEVEHVLRSADWKDFLAEMYGNSPNQWRDSLTGTARLRCIVNGLTRLRFCTEEGEMEFASKMGTNEAPAGYLPWFDVPGRKTEKDTVVFGHWSTLGLLLRDNLVALDTGCVWGGKLTAVRLEDRALFQVDCPGFLEPGVPAARPQQ
ncbi:symmetrical bis(5'-nucleosyl)-tetraphosphatase [Oxalobacter paraformigenes]|uniref:Bis(5'-nucleosyl)-tetraphosphatase, symmetrical n=1 Tax=Oxalobacter paraformigenes TaxID=556268 RepID=C3X4I4_9BURK|nr:symmetrical bis(5'-nucleosyl)-tetraphosphatase [Oxalobacter paraformigenes]EEO28120.1 bis(5'-nucleosyl)-tetraphosphatase (symmetrical) [Oxalobacter paraformigenes]